MNANGREQAVVAARPQAKSSWRRRLKAGLRLRRWLGRFAFVCVRSRL